MFKIGDEVIAFNNNKEYKGTINKIYDLGLYKFYEIKLKNGKYGMVREDFVIKNEYRKNNRY